MNPRHSLLAAMLVALLPATTQAVDWTTVDRSITKEPVYRTQPRYCLLVFGKKAETRVWLVVDGRRLFIDRNGNGDLTDPGELIESNDALRASSFQQLVNVDRLFHVDQIEEADESSVHKDFRLTVYDDDRFRCSMHLADGRYQAVGGRTLDTLPRLGASSQEAPILHFHGPLALASSDAIPMLSRGSTSTGYHLLRVWIGSPGLGAGTFAHYSADDLLEDQMVIADCEFPGRAAGDESITRRDEFKFHSGTSYGYFHPVTIPDEAGAGYAEITLSMPAYDGGKVATATLKALIVGGSQDVPTFAAALQTNEAAVRKRVMSLLRYNRYRAARDEVPQALVKQFEDWGARVGAIRGLTEFKSPQVFDLLIAALETPDAEVRAAAVRALRGYDDRAASAVPKLVAALSDQDPRVRRAAAYELRSYAPYGDAAADALAAALDDADGLVRAHAAGSLGVPGPAALKFVPALTSLLHDDEHRVRSAAASAIAAIDRTQIGAIVLKLKSADENDEIMPELAAKALRSMQAGVNYNHKSGNVTYITFNELPYADPTIVTDGDLKVLGQLADAGLLSELRSINLGGTRITDEGMPHLAKLTGLSGLNLSDTPITDEGLKWLEGLTELKYLNLEGTHVTGAGLAHIADLTKLTRLYLSRTRTDDGGLRHLENLADLTWLRLDDTPVTDEGWNHLERLSNLTYLSLCRTQVTDGGLIHLQKLKNLTALRLDRAPITSAGLAQIAPLRQLDALWLRDTAVDDAAIVHLAPLTKLRNVYLKGTRFTREGRAELDRRLHCTIQWYYAVD